jgi:hypothetical protein
MSLKPCLVFHQFLRHVEESNAILSLLSSFYDECVAYRNGVFVPLPLNEIRLDKNTITNGVRFRKRKVVDLWKFACVDKGFPVLQGELVWASAIDRQTAIDSTVVHEALAKHIVKSGTAIVVNLLDSKETRANYTPKKASSPVQRFVFRSSFLMGSTVDLYLFQRVGKALLDLTENPRVEAVENPLIHSLRDDISRALSQTEPCIVRSFDIKQFTVDCELRLATHLPENSLDRYEKRMRHFVLSGPDYGYDSSKNDDMFETFRS